MDLSVIIVAGDELPFVKESLHAADMACRGIKHELIVVDDASRDGTSDWIETTYPGVTVIRLDHHVGLSAARNVGIARSAGEFMLLVDADAMLRPDAAETLLDFMRSDDRVGIAGPRTVYPDGRLQESCRTFQTWAGFVRRGLGRPFRGRDRAILECAKRAVTPFEVDWVMGACQMVRRSAVTEVGPMDERFRLYYGDVDWCRRMRDSGWKVCYVPSAECRHRYRRRSACFPPDRWLVTHVLDFLRFRRKPRLSWKAAAPDDGRVRVLYLLDLLGLSGPPFQYAMLLRHLDRTRFEPVACATLVRSAGDRELAREIGLPFYCFEKRGWIDKFLRVPLALRRMLRSMRVDLVHGELFKANLLAAFVGALTGTATVISQSISYERNPAYSWWDMLCYRLALKLADRVIVNADVLAQRAVGRFGAPRERVKTVCYALDPCRIEPRGGLARADLGIPADARVVVTVARLVPEKGHSVLLRALARVCRDAGIDVRALFVGDGPDRERIERETRELGLEDSVKFLGTRRNIADILAISDLFVLPSFREGMPSVVMEAMAAGVPVVATAVDGTVELVEDGVTGTRVNPGDEGALAKAIFDMLADRAGAERMAQAARKRVRDTYTVERMVRATHDVYDEALARRRG